MGNRHTVRVRMPLVALAVIAVGVPSAPAFGHAGAQLPYAWWTSDGHEVVGEWTAPADDAALIGTVVGVLKAGASEAYRGGPADAFPTEEEIATLSASPDLRAYLLANLGVRQAGVACDGRVEPAADFIADGARFVFRCPEPVEEVELWVTLLHDQDPAYETLSGDGTVQDARHTSLAPAHDWDFTLSASSSPRRAPRVLYVALGGIVVGGVVVVRSLGGRRARAGHRSRRR